MKRLITFALCILTLCVINPVAAQNGPGFYEPFTGPLIGTTASYQDEILLYDLGSNTYRQLSFGYGEHHMWGFSPDGCRMLFTVDSGDNYLPKMYTSRLDGSDQQEMVIFDELPDNEWGVWEPNWSSTGNIAFTILRDLPQQNREIERESHIAWIEGIGGEPEFFSVTGSEYSPRWSPDGAWLAYVSYDERVPGADIYSTAVPTTEPPPGQETEDPTTIKEADLWVVSADGQTKYWLTNFDTGSVRSPRWSPDGELIGFIYSPSSVNDLFWMIANSPNALPTRLSNQWNITLDVTWLPDSSAMLSSVREFKGTHESRLWQIPLIGDADVDATLYAAGEEYMYTDFPRFSADGSYLALRNEYSIVIVDLSDNSSQRIYEDLPGNTPPYWSPLTFRGESACQ
jgi:Tol biopolymer transport system component